MGWWVQGIGQLAWARFQGVSRPREGGQVSACSREGAPQPGAQGISLPLVSRALSSLTIRKGGQRG